MMAKYITIILLLLLIPASVKAESKKYPTRPFYITAGHFAIPDTAAGILVTAGSGAWGAYVEATAGLSQEVCVNQIIASGISGGTSYSGKVSVGIGTAGGEVDSARGIFITTAAAATPAPISTILQEPLCVPAGRRIAFAAAENGGTDNVRVWALGYYRSILRD